MQPGSPEIQHLISTAGSAEILVAHLLKEKQQAASQNTQLWKLVDKQRSLLMGLNQDLERAIKDKEKYRRRLIDLQSQAHVIIPSKTALPEQPLPNVEPVQSARQVPAPENDITQSQPSLGSSNEKSANSLHSSPLDPAMMPSPLHLLPNQQVTNDIELSDGRESQPTPKNSQGNAKENQSASSEDHPSAQTTRQAENASFLKSPSPIQAQTLNHTVVPISMSTNPRLSPAHVAGPTTVGEKAEKMFPPTRKPPPAPLNLNPAKPNIAAQQEFAPVGLSDSDHSDLQEVQANAIPKRGRRKTRDEDDRDRELAVRREQETRSRSSKSSKSSKSGKKRSKQDMHVEAASGMDQTVPTTALPTTVRQVAVPPPSEATTTASSPPNSIAAVLSPKSHKTPAIVEHTVFVPPMSPGLPVSPRPIDRPIGSPMPRMPRLGSGIPLSPPMSPRGAAPGLPLSPRRPRPSDAQAQMPNASSSFSSSSSHPPIEVALPHPSPPKKQEMPRPTMTTILVEDKVEKRESPSSPFHGVQVDRSLMDTAYPNLLLPPKALRSIVIKVSSSRLRPKRHSYMISKSNDEDPVFTLSIFSRSGGRELWRVEKVIMALPQLDQQMKNVSNFPTKLPERKLFSGHSPAVVDARRNALNQYFGELLGAATDERSALVVCHFLSSDVIEARDDETSLLTPTQRNKPALALAPDSRPVKEGYLTKRGKNFGGWKVRYFILQGSELKYFESPGGTHLGTIKLQTAQIGKQTQSSSPPGTDDDVENQYRHAFLVLEPKRKDSSSLVRHVLCAESDRERDEWVLVLTQNVENLSDDDQNKPQASRRAEDGKSHVTGFEAKVRQYSEPRAAVAQEDRTTAQVATEGLKVIGYEQVTAGAAPTIGVQQIDRRSDTSPSRTSTSSAPNTLQEAGPNPDQQGASISSKIISGPKNGSVIQDLGSWGNKIQTNIKDKKRSMWGFRQRGGSESAAAESQPVPYGGVHQSSCNPYGPTRAVFGLPLAEAVELCPPRGVDVNLPAVVYRCIEYLHAKDAASEEGIFRLSGSNIVIKALRERFNTEGDVDFLADDQYHDVHAIASLFKSYLRELPSTVLTKELHLDFLHVLELDEKSKKIAAFNLLVHRLPRVNLSLLRALSQYLIEIVNNADKNKMNVRNMGIVFSPTLNIPAPVFAMFLTDFDAIFGAEPAETVAPTQDQIRTVELSVPNQLTADDIRSPRHQMFSDLPTPAYHQTTFPEGPPPAQFPNQVPMQPSSNLNPPANANLTTNTGFIPMQPSYETRTYVSDPQAPTQPQQRYSVAPQPAGRGEYGSMNMMLAPSNAATLKAKRRESSMLFSGIGHRKASMPQMREESGQSPTL